MISVLSLFRRTRNGFAGSVSDGFASLLLALVALVPVSACTAIDEGITFLAADCFVLFYPSILCAGFLRGFCSRLKVRPAHQTQQE